MLKNSKQLAWWQHPDTREVYVLVGVDKKVVKINTMSTGQSGRKAKLAQSQLVSGVDTEVVSNNLREVK